MLYGEINRQRLKIINEHVVADTIDYLEARFAFSEDWDGLEKWAHFAKDGEVYDIRLTDNCVRKEDHLNLSAGIWKVYLHGNEFSGGKVIERITTNAAILKVEPTGTLDGEPFPEMPASVTEQILARLENVEQNGGDVESVKSVNGVLPDENGNVEIELPEAGGEGTVKSVAGVEPDESGNVPLTPADIGAAEVEITDEEINVVTVAGTAQVGQTIVVESVDDQGRPVTWRAADIPEQGNQSAGRGVWYGTTSTEPYTAEKVVTTETGDFQLVKGARVGVKFLTNTVNCNSLIVDGAERVYIRSTNDEKGEAESSSTETPIVWHNLGQVQWFTYDGEYFIIDDSVRATASNNLCGKVSVSDSVTSTGDTVASSKAAKIAYDKAVEAINAVTALDTALAEAIGSGVVS